MDIGYGFGRSCVYCRLISKICKIVLKNTLKYSQLISSSANKKILSTTRNVRLDSGHYATKYYYNPSAIDSESIEPLAVLHSKLNFEW